MTALLLASAMMLGAWGCGETQPAAETKTETVAETAAVAETRTAVCAFRL